MQEISKQYTTISGSSRVEFEEKRSVFIGQARRVANEEEAQTFIREVKKEFRDATHNVYAYLLGDGTLARYSDDGEPQGTSGMPTLETIRKSGVTDVCVVITRYFGGTLLGAGGLVRAYSHIASLAIEAAGVITYELYDVFSLCCGYSEYQKYNALLLANKALIDSVDYGASVTLTFAVRHSDSSHVISQIIESGFGKDIPTPLPPRYDYR